MRLFAVVLPVLSARLGLAAATGTTGATLGPTTFAVPGKFPKSVFPAYYNNPTATSAQPQPVISDPVTVRSHSNVNLPSGLTSVDSTKCTRSLSPTRTTSPK